MLLPARAFYDPGMEADQKSRVTQEYFLPVENAMPATLNSAQIEHYNRQGYIAPLRLYSSQEAKNTRHYIDTLLNQVGDENRYAINCYQARLGGIWDICTDRRILDVVEDLIGPDIICWASHLFCKVPMDPKRVPWHQDADYWHLSPKRTITVWLAIDDTDQSNSAMEFIPGTHTLGAQPVRETTDDTVLHREIETPRDCKPYVNALAAGEFSVHADMLVHGSKANSSENRRCGLTIRYCPASVRMTDSAWGDNVEAIVCRGSADNYWKHHHRPDNEIVHLDKQPLNIGGN